MLQCCAAGRKQGQINPVFQAARDFLTGLTVFLIVLAMAAFHARSARSQTAAAGVAQSGQTRSLTPAQMRSGALLVRPSRSGKKDVYSEAAKLDTSVSFTVNGAIARATVIQVFRNTGKTPVDGVYVFPLPGQASVDTLAMQVGDRIIIGEIKPRAEVQALYAQAQQVDATPDSAEQRRSNIFTNAVSDIAPGEMVTVRIEYQEMLHESGGAYTLRFPLALAPHFAAKPLALGVRYDASRLDGALGELDRHGRISPPALGPNDPGRSNYVSLRVRLQAGFPLGAIDSVNHPIKVERTDDGGALLALQSAQVPADKDFVLHWRQSETEQPTAQVFSQRSGMSEYLMAMITPPAAGQTTSRKPRDVVFLIDISGSMAGSSILQARRALDAAVSRLDENDRFNIIAFDAAYESLFKTPVKADQNNKSIARQFIARLIASGGTEMTRPLSAALKDSQPDDTSRVRQVVLITDGAITNEQKLFSEIAVQRGRSRLFLIGIGPGPRSILLRRAAEVGRGGYIHIETQNELGDRIDEFLRRLESPVMTDIKIGWPKGMRAEVWPDPLPDLYAGEPLVISARTGTALKGAITVMGNFDGKPWSRDIDLAAAKKGGGVAKLWARRKIASLESNAFYAGKDSGNIGARIEKVAMAHNLVSPMTSLVAFDRTPAPQRQNGTPPAGGDAPSQQLGGWVHNGGLDEESGQYNGRLTAHPPSAEEKPHAAKRGPARFAAAAAEKTPSNSAAADAPVLAATISEQASSPPVQVAQTSGVKPVPAGAKSVSGTAAQRSFFSGQIGILTIMALLFATMSAITLGLWRQFGRLQSTDRHRRGA